MTQGLLQIVVGENFRKRICMRKYMVFDPRIASWYFHALLVFRAALT
jgi:hypothetical protein